MKRFMSAAAGARVDTAANLVEMREILFKPARLREYLQTQSSGQHLARNQEPGLLGHFVSVLGGSTSKVVTIHASDDLEARCGHSGWRKSKCRASQPLYRDTHHPLGRRVASPADAPALARDQTSAILLEALDCHEAGGACRVRDFQTPPDGECRTSPAPALCLIQMPYRATTPLHRRIVPDLTLTAGAARPVYEMRQYQLHPGYGSVPKLREIFLEGLPHKVAADPTGRLVGFLYTDFGTLNRVVELWRYPSAQACIDARQAARRVQPWRECIGKVTPGVQHFTTELLAPTPLSRWK